MYVCTLCGYLAEDVESYDDLPEICPLHEAAGEYVEYDHRLEEWVRKAVDKCVTFVDPEDADRKVVNSMLSSNIRFGLVGVARSLK